MTGMRLHHSNRMEALAAGLVRLMRADPGDPFAPERVVVPHPTIGRWLLLELARGLGIAANVRIEQPAEFAWSIMREAVPELPKEPTYAPAWLRWRIHDVLPELAQAPDGHAVRGYLGDGDPRKRFELADRLARVFDRCLLYRPDWIREWERGAAPHWQARLWQRLAGDGRGAGEGCPAGEERPPGEGWSVEEEWPNARGRFAAEGQMAMEGTAAGERRATAESRVAATNRSGGEGRGAPTAHWVAAIDAFRERIGSGVRPPGWPRRAVFFAVSSLSPSYLEALRRAAEGIEIHLFMVVPCREYWGDIRSRREIARRDGGGDPDAGYFTEGNELLAAWGRAGRDTFDALVEGESVEWEEHFVPPDGACRLAAVQRDVLDLRLASEAAQAEAAAPEDTPLQGPAADARAGTSSERTSSAGVSEGLPSAHVPSAGLPVEAASAHLPPARAQEGGQGPPPDDSLQIHVCHSPVREAEVLHDRLLGVFDAHPDLEPADVLVLTPALDVYGPAVEAVFGAAGRIPCNVARARGGESRTLRTFLDLLDLPGSRLGAEAVLAPLDAPAVRARFGIGEGDLPALRGLVREAGIRWGADQAHRGAEGLPETAGHTWRQGLRRLLLGYAMPDADVLVGGLAPCPAGADGLGAGEVGAELLGRFVSYCEEVIGLDARLAGERRPAQWAGVLRGVVNGFLAGGPGPARGGGGAGTARGAGTAGGIGSAWGTGSAGGPGTDGGTGGAGGAGHRRFAGESADEVDAIRALVRDFGREAGQGESPVPFALVRDVLRERARDVSGEPARLADGVTVAGLAPGRVFPAAVVCVVGMNDGAFPRTPSYPSFDLMAAGPARRGDRDVRHEDRFAFLEALLAARRCFLVSYTGRGLRDDAPIPPSVLVDELKDYLAQRFPDAAIETRHPLQPFSPRYFQGGARRTPGEGARSADEAADLPADPPADGTLFSYSRGMCEAAKAMLAGEQDPAGPGRFARPLPEPDESRREVDPAELVSFFANPARFFLRHRLGARLEVDDATLDEEEPFELDGLERYRLRSEVWSRMRAGAAPERTEALLSGRGRLPQAGLGRVVHEREWEEAEELERQLAPYRAALDAPSREVDFEIGGFRVVGALERIGPDGTMVWPRLGRLRARDRIEIRLRLLVWAAAGNGPVEAVGISRERSGKQYSWKSERFPAPERAGEQLERWLRAWWRGLAAPLPFFPETSYAYARGIARPGRHAGAAVQEDARDKARAAWLGNDHQPGEGDDPCFRLVHDGALPLTPEFEDLAVELLAPLIAPAQRDSVCHAP